MAIKKNALEMMKKNMGEDNFNDAVNMANHELLSLRLKELRKTRQIRQSNVKGFTQSAISHFESRKDIKISSLVDYLANIGMGVEIKAIDKKLHTKKLLLQIV